MASYLLAVPFILHGLANISGILAPWTKSLLGFTNSSWLFASEPTFDSWLGRGYSLIWLVSTIFLLAAGVSVVQHRPTWVVLAIAGCLFSFLAILPWWRAVPPGARFGAIFDLVVLIGLLSPLAG